MPSVFHGFWDSNSGPCACVPITLSTEPPLQPSGLNLWTALTEVTQCDFLRPDVPSPSYQYRLKQPFLLCQVYISILGWGRGAGLALTFPRKMLCGSLTWVTYSKGRPWEVAAGPGFAGGVTHSLPGLKPDVPGLSHRCCHLIELDLGLLPLLGSGPSCPPHGSKLFFPCSDPSSPVLFWTFILASLPVRVAWRTMCCQRPELQSGI